MQHVQARQGFSHCEVAKPPQRISHTALVVGGDEFFRLALVSILRFQFNYECVIDADFSKIQSDAIPSEAPIDLVLIEAHCALSGSDHLTRLRRRYPGTRMVVVSQSVRRDDVLDALRAGAHGFVPKTVSVADMVSALTLILNGALWIPTSLDDDRSDPSEAMEQLKNDNATDVQDLTPRQRQVLRHIVQGKSNKEIAKLMFLREGTVKVHVAALLRTLGVPNRSRAAAIGSHRIFSN